MKNISIKVCGMRDTQNIIDIAQIPNITHLGFIFTPKSQRFVGHDFEMPELPTHIQKVGVFLDQSLDEVLAKCAKYNLDMIQLHGNESPDYCQYAQSPMMQGRRGLEKRPKIIKAFSIDEYFDMNILAEYSLHCDFFLLDTKGKNAGGNGVTFDWEILKNHIFERPIFLSGGISLENMQKLQDFLTKNPQIPIQCLDINSKFEDNIALKNVGKIKAFLEL